MMFFSTVRLILSIKIVKPPFCIRRIMLMLRKHGKFSLYPFSFFWKRIKNCPVIPRLSVFRISSIFCRYAFLVVVIVWQTRFHTSNVSLYEISFSNPAPLSIYDSRDFPPKRAVRWWKIERIYRTYTAFHEKKNKNFLENTEIRMLHNTHSYSLIIPR